MLLPPSQVVLLVILIVLALVLLNWEVNNAHTALDELPDESIPVESNTKLTQHDQNQLSS
jgi:regulatory protein YycI of two-component signal transduction system YycFG